MKLRRDIVTLPSVHPSKLGTYLVLGRVWNPIDFQGHRTEVKVTGSNFYAREYATLCVALVKFHSITNNIGTIVKGRSPALCYGKC